ncbi:MAG: GGDEF domain-containing protein [Myxococcota bacterium]
MIRRSVVGTHGSALGPAFEHAPVAQIAVALGDGELLAANGRARVLLDISDTAEIVVGADRFFGAREKLGRLLRATANDEQVTEPEMRMKTLRGEDFWARIDVSRLDDVALVAVQDIGIYKNENATLRDLAEQDSLTGLPNRRAYTAHAERAIARSYALGDPLCLAIIDVEFFKGVNDAHGHLTGDRVLQTLAHLARETLRRTDFIARYGGEEFVVLMPGTTAGAARNVLERLRSQVERLAIPSIRNQDLRVTVSVGFSEVREDDSEMSLLERADRALYRAKTLGRNRIEEG